jgi:hypothetical protein
MRIPSKDTVLQSAPKSQRMVIPELHTITRCFASSGIQQEFKLLDGDFRWCFIPLSAISIQNPHDAAAIHGCKNLLFRKIFLIVKSWNNIRLEEQRQNKMIFLKIKLKNHATFSR